MVVILCEDIFEESIWCQKIYNGLKKELKKRRISYSKTSDSNTISSGDTVYIIGSSYIWINNSISLCNALNIVPIVLCNQINDMLYGKYHSISTDTNACMKQLISSTNTTSLTRIALYGINNNSLSDLSRTKSYIEQTNNTSGIFVSNGSLENCFNKFIPRVSEFDTVICVNNYAAISLVRNLSENCPSALERLEIISCSSSKLSSIFSKFIIFVDTNFECYGKAALEISELSEKNPYISGINVTINWDSNSTPLPKTAADKSDIAQIDSFYKDAEILKLLKIEKLLDICDDLDMQIIKMLMNGNSYDTIAEKCLFAKESVKYRIKKYIKICEVNTKSEFIDLINEINPFTLDDCKIKKLEWYNINRVDKHPKI